MHRSGPLLALVLLTVLAAPASGQKAPPKGAAQPAPAPGEAEYNRLAAEFAAAQQAYYRPIREAQTDAQRNAIHLDPAAHPYRLFLPRFEALADAHPGTPTELRCLVWVCTNAPPLAGSLGSTLWQLYLSQRWPARIGLAAVYGLIPLVLVLGFLKARRGRPFPRAMALVNLAMTAALIAVGSQWHVPAGPLGVVLPALAGVWLVGMVVQTASAFRRRSPSEAPDAVAGKKRPTGLALVTNGAMLATLLVWVVGVFRDQPTVRMPSPVPPELRQALDHILHDHGRDPGLGDVLPALAGSWCTDAAFFQSVLETSPHRDVQGKAALCLAEKRRDQGDEGGAVAVLERVGREYAEVPWGQETLGAVAERVLQEIQSLAVGKVAPEIEGEDADGKHFKLSDYRGKVVVLDFWGDW